MRSSVEDAIPVLQRVIDEIAHAKWSAHPETIAFHLQKAYQKLADALTGPSSGALSDQQVGEIKSAAHFLKGIQAPTELRAEADGWSRDLLALI